MMMQDELRLLPWAGPDGKPCYLSTNKPDGYMSRLADNIEAMQLGLASQLREEALQVLDVLDVLDDGDADTDTLSLLAARLVGALGDVLRVATSRGNRL
jgi:hypothetical protein